MGVPERKEPREPGPAYVFVPTLGACCILVFYILFGGLFAADRGAAVVTPRADPNALSVATWNVAAINNNPFEYWITHDDKAYNELMADVQAFVSEPGSRDVPVSEVFTDAMWGELEAAMTGAGWAGVPDVAAIWNGDFRNRKIVTEFLKDGTLGETPGWEQSRRRRGYDVDVPRRRGDAAATTWTFRGDASRRGDDVDL